MRQLKLPGREGVVQVRPGPPALQRHALDSRERPGQARAELKARGNQTAGNDRSRREAGKGNRKSRRRGGGSCFIYCTPTDPASQSRSPPRAFPALFPAGYEALNPFCEGDMAVVGSRTRLADPSLWGSQRSQRVLPTRRLRSRESHPLAPAAGSGALGPCPPAPLGARPPWTPGPTYQAGQCGQRRADRTSVCCPAPGSTGRTAEARKLTLGASSSAGTCERAPANERGPRRPLR